MLRIENLGKRFTLHVQDGAEIPVFQGVDLALDAGDCVALTGPSGTGKSSLLRMIYANYLCQEGRIDLWHDGAWVDMATAAPRTVLDVRRRTLGYVSQFLRVIPRVPTLDVVAEPLRAMGAPADAARDAAAALLRRLNIPQALWRLSPVTFSGGEKQRINVARGFVAPYPVLLLDEPTASLDAANSAIVLELIAEARARGAAVLGIFHDRAARDAVCTDQVDVTRFKPGSKAVSHA
ncbi:MAG: phosphonate C-P lyase system protein PhnL [Rhodobacterales bacterium]|nr:phosphonate C-P lyase system protein PhnL [Rhodobacterales bacterium]